MSAGGHLRSTSSLRQKTIFAKSGVISWHPVYKLITLGLFLLSLFITIIGICTCPYVGRRGSLSFGHRLVKYWLRLVNLVVWVIRCCLVGLSFFSYLCTHWSAFGHSRHTGLPLLGTIRCFVLRWGLVIILPYLLAQVCKSSLAALHLEDSVSLPSLLHTLLKLREQRVTFSLFVVYQVQGLLVVINAVWKLIEEFLLRCQVIVSNSQKRHLLI